MKIRGPPPPAALPQGEGENLKHAHPSAISVASLSGNGR